MCGQRAGCNAGTLTARRKLPRGMCRQRAGCNPGTAKADGQRAWWKLPRGSWRVLGVLSVWSLANGRLEGPNKRGLCAGKGQAAMLERWRPGAWWKLPRGMCRQRAGCNAGAAKADCQRAWSAWWKLPRGSWRVLGVFSVWSLANGRLEGPNKRWLCAGKGQAAMLERWRPGAWWKLPRGSWRVLGVLRVWSLANGRLEGPNKRGLCAGKGQAAMLERWRPGGSCREECAGKGQVALSC